MSNSVPLGGTWFYGPQTGVPNSTSYNPQQAGVNTGVTANPQPAGINTGTTANPNDYIDPVADTPASTTSTAVDPAAAAAAAAAAAQAALVGKLRGDVTNLVNSIKDIYNTRYGQVDNAAGEQIGKLNERFGNESGDITRQVTDENNALGAAYAGKGTFDSSYRGNSVDQTTAAGTAQIRDLGQELQENTGKVGSWVAQQKAGYDAQKGGLDTVLSHLAESTDPNELTQIRNTLESRIAELQAGSADNNTAAQNATALETIAPSSARVVKLKSTLSQIVAGNADTSQKSAIAQSLIANSGLSADEQQKLVQAFQSDLSSSDPKDQTQTA